MSINFQPIGVLRTPYKNLVDMPIQPASARGVRGRLELSPVFAEGLISLSGFSHIIVLYHFHRVTDVRLTVTPFLDSQPRGVFATRAPVRPNPVGLSIVRLSSVNGSLLEVEDVDMLDETPVIDIKPYVPSFDLPVGSVRSGWFENIEDCLVDKRSDDRFIKS